MVGMHHTDKEASSSSDRKVDPADVVDSEAIRTARKFLEVQPSPRAMEVRV